MNILEIENKVKNVLINAKKEDTFQHSLEVAKEARRLANIYHINQEAAYVSGLLHDISAIIPNEKRIAFHEERHLDIFPEEYQLPLLLHQQQSAIIAREMLQIHDKGILNAIACHTTLRKNPSELDLVLFVADKIKWDRQDAAPYLIEIEESVEISLIEAAKIYVNWGLKNEIKIPHPWFLEASAWLEKQK